MRTSRRDAPARGLALHRSRRAGGVARRCHRDEARGLDRLLRPGAALLVGDHGRPIACDLCMLTVTLRARLGYLPHG